MNDQQLLRYARHLMLEDFGFEGQERLLNSQALIIGLGGLGSATLPYLAAAGLGGLHLVDDDLVDLSNLQRQIIHSTHNIGLSKVESARQFALSLNPDLNIQLSQERLDDVALYERIQTADIVLDCTDNFQTRQQINRLCCALHRPWVSAAAIRYVGQITVFDARDCSCPCYACQYSPEDNLPPDNCATLGVFGPLLGIMGSLQANETIKLLLGIGQPLTHQLLLINNLNMQVQKLRLNKDPCCQVCGSQKA